MKSKRTKMKKYEIEYKNIKIAYTAEKLENAAKELSIEWYEMQDNHDYLVIAVKWFCHTHFMYGNAAHLEQYDAETRGHKVQEWKYQPNGTFKGWICARLTE